MTTAKVAKVIEEVYYSGRVKAGSRRLEYADFLILVQAAKADILADLYRQEKAQGMFLSLNNFLEAFDVTIEKDNYGQRFFTLPVEVISLPDNAGVFSFIPVVDSQLKFCDAYFRTEAGSQWMLCDDDSGQGYFIPLKDKVMIYGGSDCHTKGQVQLMPNTEESNIPDDISFKVARMVWRETMGTRNFPVDKQVDDNPNVDDYLKTKLSAAQIS